MKEIKTYQTCVKCKAKKKKDEWFLSESTCNLLHNNKYTYYSKTCILCDGYLHKMFKMFTKRKYYRVREIRKKEHKEYIDKIIKRRWVRDIDYFIISDILDSLLSLQPVTQLHSDIELELFIKVIDYLYNTDV